MLSEEEARRYSRQMQLAEIGLEGQARIAAGRVLVAGLGGLGSIGAFYLAAAGVGHLRLVDRDRVTLDNLNRQILHATSDIGRMKAASAAEKLSRLNSHCRLEAIETDIGDVTVESLVEGCSVIFDGTDNRATRQVLNSASVKKEVPFVCGGISGWEGMASTFVPGRTPCFSCLFPAMAEAAADEPPPALGPTAGLIASLQCLDTLRLLIGQAPLLAGRLLRFSGTTMEFRSLPIERNPHCTVCRCLQYPSSP